MDSNLKTSIAAAALTAGVVVWNVDSLNNDVFVEVQKIQKAVDKILTQTSLKVVIYDPRNPDDIKTDDGRKYYA